MIHLQGCVPCKKAMPEFERLSNMWPDVQFGEFLVRPDDPQARVLVRDWGVRATPTFHLYAATAPYDRLQTWIGYTGLAQLYEHLMEDN